MSSKTPDSSNLSSLLLAKGAPCSISGNSLDKKPPGSLCSNNSNRKDVYTLIKDQASKTKHVTNCTEQRRSLRNSGQDSVKKATNEHLNSKIMERELLHKPIGVCPCTSYRADREQRFPHYWFCHQCSLWDIEAGANNLLHISSVSRLFRFRAKLKLQSLFPTHLKKVHFTLQGKKHSEEDDDMDFSEGEEESWVECNSEEYNKDYYNDDNVFECNEEYVFSSDDENIEWTSNLVTTKKSLPAKHKHSNDTGLQEDCTYQRPPGSQSTPTVSHSESCSVALFERKEEVPSSETEEIINCLRDKVSNHLSQNATLQQEVHTLKKLVTRLCNEKIQLRSNIASYTSAVGTPNSHNASSSSSSKASMRTCISSAQSLVNVLHSYGTQSNVSLVNQLLLEKVGGMLADILWDKTLINGSLTGALLAKAKGYLSRNEFSPANILRAMDLRGGVLNYEGLEILRKCETNGKKFCCNTVIPSTASLQRTAKIVQGYGKQHFPFTIGKVPARIGENIRFQPMDVIKAAVHSAGLEESAKKRRIQLAESLDGAKLSKNLNFVVFGLKNNEDILLPSYSEGRKVG